MMLVYFGMGRGWTFATGCILFSFLSFKHCLDSQVESQISIMDPDWRCISYRMRIFQPATLVYGRVPSTYHPNICPKTAWNALGNPQELQGSGWFVASTILDNPGPGPDITKPIEIRPFTGLWLFFLEGKCLPYKGKGWTNIKALQESCGMEGGPLLILYK